MMWKHPKHPMIPGISLRMCPEVSVDVCSKSGAKFTNSTGFNSYLSLSGWCSSLKTMASIIERSLFMDTPLGAGETGLCW